jgi:hypothetical protein
METLRSFDWLSRESEYAYERLNWNPCEKRFRTEKSIALYEPSTSDVKVWIEP